MGVCKNNMRVWKIVANIVSNHSAVTPDMAIRIRAEQHSELLSPLNKESDKGR
jgi:plasmid maintenance system antidote protein VapI